MYLIRR